MRNENSTNCTVTWYLDFKHAGIVKCSDNKFNPVVYLPATRLIYYLNKSIYTALSASKWSACMLPQQYLKCYAYKLQSEL